MNREDIEELNDIVDEYDRPAQKIARSSVGDNFVNVRYVSAFLTNSEGKLWIPRRKQTLERWPGGLDFTMGGAVLAGESYEAAAQREIFEELGIRVGAQDLHEIAYLSPNKFPVACFLKIYEWTGEEAPTKIEAEYAGGRWYEIDELVSELSANLQPHKGDLLPVVRLCYGAMKQADRKQYQP